MSIDAEISASVDLLGKSVTDLQSGIEIANGGISGTLLYVDDYTGFSSDPDEQVGNFLALHVNVPDDADVTVEVVGGTSGPALLDADRIIVDKIRSTTQKIKVVASMDGYGKELVYTLTGLTLNAS